jgi:outer membrane lipoprotein-sorting protein
MRKVFYTLLIALLSLPLGAQQTPQAKRVLEQTASAFRKAGAVQAELSIKSYKNRAVVGESKATLSVKGEQFMLKSPDVQLWFDGKTQWSYLPSTEEVNISNPTPAELQTLNPYLLFRSYQQEYNYTMGALTQFRGKAIEQVILTGKSARPEITRLLLYLSKADHLPLYLEVEQRDGTRNEITIIRCQTAQKFPPSLFTFNKKEFPQAEIIDLR